MRENSVEVDKSSRRLDLPLELVDWAFQNGIDNMKRRHDTYSFLRKEAVFTFNIAFFIAAGFLSFGLPGVIKEPNVLNVGALVASFYLYLICLYLLFSVLKPTPIPSIYNQPENLMIADLEVRKIKEEEVKLLQNRTDRMMRLIQERDKIIHKSRVLIVVFPLVSAIGMHVGWCHGLRLV